MRTRNLWLPKMCLLSIGFVPGALLGADYSEQARCPHPLLQTLSYFGSMTCTWVATQEHMDTCLYVTETRAYEAWWPLQRAVLSDQVWI